MTSKAARVRRLRTSARLAGVAGAFPGTCGGHERSGGPEELTREALLELEQERVPEAEAKGRDSRKPGVQGSAEAPVRALWLRPAC